MNAENIHPNVHTNEQPPTDAATSVVALSTKGASRNIWPQMEQTTMKSGKQIVYHPFLHESNLKEQIFYTHLYTLKPFAAEHGESTLAWDQLVKDINKEKGPDGLSVFSTPLVVCTAKERFKIIMKFAGQNIGKSLNSTGNDSQPEPTKVQRQLELLFEVFTQSKSKDGQLKGIQSYAEKKRDKTEGEICNKKILRPTTKQRVVMPLLPIMKMFHGVQRSVVVTIQLKQLQACENPWQRKISSCERSLPSPIGKRNERSKSRNSALRSNNKIFKPNNNKSNGQWTISV
jgi:hypothetical protein